VISVTRPVAALIIFLAAPCHASRAQEIPVYVSASFTDRNNLYVEDLAPEEVEILQDGKPRRIEFMARDELSAAYGIIFERALLGEPGDERRFGLSDAGAAAARNLAYELVDKHLRRQVFWIGCYDKELAVALDFTSDAFQAHAAIQQLRGGRGPEESFLYGALFAALRRMNERHEKRRVLIVFLESVDPGTLDRIKPLKNILSLSNVELFCVRFGARVTGRPGGVSPQMSDARAGGGHRRRGLQRCSLRRSSGGSVAPPLQPYPHALYLRISRRAPRRVAGATLDPLHAAGLQGARPPARSRRTRSGPQARIKSAARSTIRTVSWQSAV